MNKNTNTNTGILIQGYTRYTSRKAIQHAETLGADMRRAFRYRLLKAKAQIFSMLKNLMPHFPSRFNRREFASFALGAIWRGSLNTALVLGLFLYPKFSAC